MDSCIRTSVEGGVATMTIARPPVNVLTLALLRELGGCLERLAPVGDLRAVVLAAEGKHFSAGADVGEHLTPSYRELIPAFLRTLEAVASFPLPVIAAVRGRCLGGGFELVQMADLIVAGAGASFGQPEILLGVTAPAACAMLPRLTHRGTAAEILFTGEAIGAERALACGLVQRVVADERVEEEALSIARRCAGLSAAALRMMKRTLLATAGLPRTEALRAAGAVYMDELMQTADAGEGLSAFVEERTPVWRHR